MKIIDWGGLERHTEYRHYFEYTDSPGAGFSFPCDENGNLEDLSKEAQANYEECLRGKINGSKIVDRGIDSFTNEYRRPPMGLCGCGNKIELGHFTNQCVCGNLYNSSGQRLSNPDTWGEETGEHPADIWRIP